MLVNWTAPVPTTACTIAGSGGCSQTTTSIPGFIYLGQYENSQIFCSNTSSFTWQEAKNAANLAGGHLAVIDGQAKNDFIKNAIGANIAWLGYTDQYSEGYWDWVSSTGSSYENWANGEPNNQSPNGGEGDFAVIKKTNGKWYDRDGNEQYEFVMEVPCPATTTTGEVNLTQVGGPLNGTFFPQGNHLIEYQATDTCGDVNNCSFYVNVYPTSTSTNGSVGDFVWQDTNGNGLQDAGEPGLPNVFVMLTDCAGNWKGQTTTDANGHYAFTDLPVGSYKIKFVVPDMTVSPTQVGNDNSIDNDVNQGWTGFTDCFDIVASVNRTDIDAGFMPNGTAGGTLTLNTHPDINVTAPTSAGTVVTWVAPTASSTCPVGAVAVSQTSGPSSGDLLLPGTYAVVYQAADGCGNTKTTSFTITVTTSGASGPGSVGDFVWADYNGNGIQDAGEPGLSGVFVMLTDCSGAWKNQTTTDANGAYSFTNLTPGSYKIKFVYVDGVVSPTQAGTDPTKDNDVNQGWTGFTDCFTISQGQNRTDIDAGFVVSAPAMAILDPNTQPKFVNPLTIPSIMQPNSGNHYDVDIVQFTHDPGLVNPATGQPLYTTMWGYNGEFPGPSFVVNANQAITVQWNNQLVNGNQVLPHILPVDTTIHWARPTGYPASGVPIVTHLHGGHTESASDGYPDAWYTPFNGPKGNQYVKSNYTYDNTQESTLLWYHDHAVGITRLNVYAGLAGAYIIRDAWENSLNLPSGEYEVPLIITDKSFYEDGSLYYPSESPDPNHPNPTVLPEMYGDIILVNGKAWPVLDVEPRKYRFRVLDASDSRFYHMALSNGMPFTIVGTDGGFIDAPTNKTDLLIAPAERYDIILDFSNPAYWGQTIELTNDANSPYPAGDPVDAPNAGKIMAFRVNKPLKGSDGSVVPSVLRPTVLPTPPAPVRTRQVTLNEGMDAIGRLKPILGTIENGVLNWTDPITENPQVNEPEIWEVINTTGDAHPVHLHQIFFQVLDHQPFDLNAFDGTAQSIVRLGQPIPATKDFKDTYMVLPGEIARFAVTFDLPGLYVWHCHILSHEDFDMMRPLYVGDCTAPTNTPTPLEFMNCGNTGVIGSIGDFVWNDANGNGIQDAGESGLPNAFVMLTDCQNNWLNQTTSDASGHYSFDNLAPGDYKVKFAPPAGFAISPTHAGNDVTKDSDVEPGWTGFTACVTLAPNQSRLDIDAGFIGISGMVGTEAFLDLSIENHTTMAKLGWENNTSDIVDYFLIQRSKDGINYESIGQAAPQKAGSMHYDFNDFEPFKGTNYYRVVAMTLAGNSVFSNTVNAEFNGSAGLFLYPNPAHDRINLDLSDFDGQSVTVSIINPVGVRIQSKQLDVSKELISIDVADVPSGIYQVQVNGEDGHRAVKKIVIDRL